MILLLHPPPGPGGWYQLDGYCSQPQKGPFRWHPVDFCAFAGAFAREAPVRIADPGSVDGAGAGVVVGLAGAFGWEHHRGFWRSVIARGARVYLSGDIARHEPRFVFESLPGLAGILPELAAPPRVSDLLAGSGPGIWTAGGPFELPAVPQGFRIGVQPFELWDHARYALPFVEGRFASVIGQVGCPHQCSYCILSSYPAATRDLDELREELAAVKRLGARHVYVRDATVNSSSRYLERLCELLASNGLPWNAFARADGAGKHARMLAESGCRVLQLGIDSPSAAVLRSHDKHVPRELAGDIAALRAAGITTVGHFVLGLAGDGTSAAAAASHARALGLDWLTITPLMVRPGTAHWPGTSALGEPADRREGAAHAPAIAAALRRFYLRPRTLLRVGRALGSRPSLLVRAGLGLVSSSRKEQSHA